MGLEQVVFAEPPGNARDQHRRGFAEAHGVVERRFLAPALAIALEDVVDDLLAREMLLDRKIRGVVVTPAGLCECIQALLDQPARCCPMPWGRTARTCPSSPSLASGCRSPARTAVKPRSIRLLWSAPCPAGIPARPGGPRHAAMLNHDSLNSGRAALGRGAARHGQPKLATASSRTTNAGIRPQRTTRHHCTIRGGGRPDHVRPRPLCPVRSPPAAPGGQACRNALRSAVPARLPRPLTRR